MQFKVPQFLDIEDKIFGPFTFSQFAYLAGGAGISYFLYKILGFWLGIIPILFIISLALALTFYRPNDKPFVDMIESAFSYMFNSKLYIWQRDKIEKKEVFKKEKEEEEIIHNPKLNKSKLRDLAWSLDILDFKKEKQE
ncbi:MAG: PrgI family protein [Candidatus Pacebacteria bacterium]|jgi:hypothetical protein|nr:PrgI family protein [Candidatus Paceibacterota bacterium]